MCFFKVNNVLDSIDEFWQNFNIWIVGLDINLFSWYFQGQNNINIFTISLLLDDLIKPINQILRNWLIDNVRQTITLPLLLGELKLVEQLVRYFDYVSLLNYYIVYIWFNKESIFLSILFLAQLRRTVSHPLQVIENHKLLGDIVEFIYFGKILLGRVLHLSYFTNDCWYDLVVKAMVLVECPKLLHNNRNIDDGLIKFLGIFLDIYYSFSIELILFV